MLDCLGFQYAGVVQERVNVSTSECKKIHFFVKFRPLTSDFIFCMVGLIRDVHAIFEYLILRASICGSIHTVHGFCYGIWCCIMIT